jgi:nitrate reductase beta subunit
LLKNDNYYYYYFTAIGLTPGGSSKHLHTNSTQNTEAGTQITKTKKEKNYKEKITITRKNWKQDKNWEGKEKVGKYKNINTI